jgi:undecaprenyl diphosphate synthase
MLIPKHIAFIMDGNGRWATERGWPRSAGHKAGYEHIPNVLEICRELGVEVVSGYAWSTENWGRPKQESAFILRALEKHLPRFVDELHSRKVRFIHSGFTASLTPKARKRLEEARVLTAENRGGVFNLAYNYGGRAEIIHTIVPRYTGDAEHQARLCDHLAQTWQATGLQFKELVCEK